MTIFGILWLCIVLWDFVKKPVTNTVFLTILFMTFQSTNILYVNGTGIGPGVLTSIVCILKIFFIQKFKIRKILLSTTTFVTAFLVLFVVYIFSNCCLYSLFYFNSVYKNNNYSRFSVPISKKDNHFSYNFWYYSNINYH